MRFPRTVNELQIFIGMIDNVGRFIPNLTEHTTPLRKMLCLSCEDIACELQNPQLDAILNSKVLVTSVPCLKFFDLKLLTHLRTDVSSVGFGTFLEPNLEP